MIGEPLEPPKTEGSENLSSDGIEESLPVYEPAAITHVPNSPGWPTKIIISSISGVVLEKGISTEVISILINARSNSFELTRLLSTWLPSFSTVPVYWRPSDNSIVAKLVPFVTGAVVRIQPVLLTKNPVPNEAPTLT